MPYAPNVNPNLGAIMMAQGIKEAGEALGGAAGALAGGAMGGSQEASGMKLALAGSSDGTGNLGAGGAGGFLEQLKSFGLTDEQIARYRQYLADPRNFESYSGAGMGARDFGVQ